MTTTPILQGPDWNLPFHIYTDASNYAIGAVLAQKHSNLEHAIYYISKSLHGPELNYTVTEKELLAVVYALKKNWHYITGYSIYVHTDHAAIKYLMNKPAITGRLARWLLLLQEFDITIVDKPGKVSRIHHHDTDTTLVDDAFTDEHLFHIAIKVPWYADIANYIAANKTPAHFSYKERKLLIQKSFHFSWIDNLLFYTGPDQVMRRCVREDETYDILHACHNEPMEDILQPKGQLSKSWQLVIIGLPFIRMQSVIQGSVTNVKGWVAQLEQMKCL